MATKTLAAITLDEHPGFLAAIGGSFPATHEQFKDAQLRDGAEWQGGGHPYPFSTLIRLSDFLVYCRDRRQPKTWATLNAMAAEQGATRSEQAA